MLESRLPAVSFRNSLLVLILAFSFAISHALLDFLVNILWILIFFGLAGVADESLFSYAISDFDILWRAFWKYVWRRREEATRESVAKGAAADRRHRRKRILSIISKNKFTI